MNRRAFAVAVATLLPAAGLASAQKNQPPDIPVTNYLADYDSGGIAYFVQSDDLGPYGNAVSGVISILVANGYDHIVNGDWRLDLLGSTVRAARVTFSPANAVRPGDPGYTAPANPPYWGTKLEAVRMENKCTLINRDMLTMKAGDRFTCPTIIHLPPLTSSTYYRLDMAASWTFQNEPETQDAQVSCNSADAGGCNDWFIDPVPVVNPDGSTSPGQARARLNLVDSRGSNNLTDEGDFYLTFHFHVTRP